MGRQEREVDMDSGGMKGQATLFTAGKAPVRHDV